MATKLSIVLVFVLAVILATNACASAPSPSSPGLTPSSPAPATSTASSVTATTSPVAATTTSTTPAPSATAPVTSPRPTNAPSGTLRVAVPDFSFESMDPIQYDSIWGWAMYDPLIQFDPRGNVTGVLAESYALSPDGLTWTFKLRKGVKFHNGDPFTSADVAFTVTRFAGSDSTNPWSPYLRGNFDSVSTPDEYTFVYKSKKPEPTLVVPFTATRIIPKNYFEKVGQVGFRASPVGTGAWKFVKWVSRTSMEMAANTDSWRLVPAYARVIELMVPEEASRVALLKSGNADVITGISLDRQVELQKAGYRLQEVGLPTVANLTFPGTWVTQGPTGDIRIRQAMSYAINRQELSNTFFKGLAKPGSRWFMDEHTWGWDPTWKADPYDPAKTKQLLADAGYPAKYASQPPINIWVQAGGGYIPDLMLALQGYWDAAGIKTKINITDAANYAGMFLIRNTKPDAPNVGAIFPWAYSSTFNNVYHSANMFTSVGVHSTGNDPKADELYARTTSELDPNKAKQNWTDFFTYVNGLYINVGLVYLPSYVVVGSGVGDFSNNAHLSLWDAYAGVQHK